MLTVYFLQANLRYDKLVCFFSFGSKCFAATPKADWKRWILMNNLKHSELALVGF